LAVVGTCIAITSGTDLTELAKMWIENYPLSPGGALRNST